MPIKIIFSDIDGTFISSKYRVMPKTKQAVRDLLNRGIPFALVSGRMPDAIYTVAGELDVTMPIVGYSGAIAITETGEVVFDKRMKESDTRAVISCIAQNYPAAVMNYYAGREWYVEDLTAPLVVQDEKITRTKAKRADFAELLSQNILPNKIMIMGEEDLITAMAKNLPSKFSSLTVVRSASYLLEIMDGGISKALGIGAMLEHYGLQPSDALAFGDHLNDKEMLQYVGTGVAMGNAIPEIKAIAKDVTLDNDNEGIYEYLRRIGLCDEI